MPAALRPHMINPSPTRLDKNVPILFRGFELETQLTVPIYEDVTTRMVGRFRVAILAATLMNLSLFSLTGVMLESGIMHRRESYQIALRNYRP